MAKPHPGHRAKLADYPLVIDAPSDFDENSESVEQNRGVRRRIDRLDKKYDRIMERISKDYETALKEESSFAIARRVATTTLGLPKGALRSRRLNATLKEMVRKNRSEAEIDRARIASEAATHAYEHASTTGERLGLAEAERQLYKLIAVHGGRMLVKGSRGQHTLDVVAVIGRGPNARLVVIEAKGGKAKFTGTGDAVRPGLGTRQVYSQDGRTPGNGTYSEEDIIDVQQGSRLYLEDLLRMDTDLIAKLRRHYPDIHRALRGQRGAAYAPIDYYLIKGNAEHPSTGGRTSAYGWEFLNLAENSTDQVRYSLDPPVLPAARKKLTAAKAIGVILTGVVALPLAGELISPVNANADAGDVRVDATMQLDGALLSDSIEAPSDGGFLAGVKATIAEFGRMATSFTNYVQNGLNELVVMVGGAVSAVSGFVSDVIDSAGVQAVIDRVSDDWAFAQGLLNIAMLFSPVGTVAAAISAAVPIIQLIVEHWDQIRAAFDWVLKNVLTPVAEFFMTAFKIYITPYRLAFDAVMAGFNGMGGVVGTAVGAVRSTVVGIVKAIGQIFQRLEINIGFPINKSFGLKSIGDAMVAWASERLADGGLVGGQRGPAPRRASGIEVMAVIDRSVLRAAQAEERKIGYAYRPPFLHDGALPRTDSGPGPRTFDVRVSDVDAAFTQIRMLQAVQDARFSPVGV